MGFSGIETPQADQVLCKVVFAFVTRIGLPDANRRKTLFLQCAQNLDCRDGAEPFGTAGVGLHREDRRREAAHLIFREGAGAFVKAGGVRVNRIVHAQAHRFCPC
jgi:hypothetical protein